MITIPVYNSIMVPDVKLYFKQETFERLTGRGPETDEKVLLLFTKVEESLEDLTPDSFYPIGLLGKVTGERVNEYWVVHTETRVDIYTVEIDEKHQIHTTYSNRPDVGDMSASDQKNHAEDMKNALVDFVRTQKWGEMVRSYMLQWSKSMTSLQRTVSPREQT